MNKPKRILLKLSGEALSKDLDFGYDWDFVDKVVDQLETLYKEGVQIGFVVGGGNFWRGRNSADMDRSTADYMGMLATVMNGLALSDVIKSRGIPCKVLSSIQMDRVAEFFTKDKALKYFDEGNILIFVGGTGSPYFSTDSGAALRAAEIGADAIYLAKNVDGVYDSDPKINENAKKFDEISFIDFVKLGLKAMDTTAVTLCMENNIPVLCFMLDEGSIIKAVRGEKMGTWIR